LFVLLAGLRGFLPRSGIGVVMATIETRRTVDGQESYRVKVRLKDYPVQYASFRRLTDAHRWVQSTESAIREGRHFKTSEATYSTWLPSERLLQVETSRIASSSNSAKAV